MLHALSLIIGILVGAFGIVGTIGGGMAWIIRKGVIDPLITPIINNVARLSDSIDRLSSNQEKRGQLLDEQIKDHEHRLDENEKHLAVHDQHFEELEKDRHS